MLPGFLCCSVRHFTLTLPLLDQEHKQDLLAFLTNWCWRGGKGVNSDRAENYPGVGEVLTVT